MIHRKLKQKNMMINSRGNQRLYKKGKILLLSYKPHSYNVTTLREWRTGKVPGRGWEKEGR